MLKKQVLVLEDEDNIRSFIVVNLQQAGYTNATNIGGISRYRGKVVQ